MDNAFEIATPTRIYLDLHFRRYTATEFVGDFVFCIGYSTLNSTSVNLIVEMVIRGKRDR